MRIASIAQVPGGGLPVSPKASTPQQARRARWRTAEQDGPAALRAGAVGQQRNQLTAR